MGSTFYSPGLNFDSPLPAGDQLVISQDTSFFREGSWSTAGSGGIQTLVGDFVMKYWSHNTAIDPNGNFLGRDDVGACLFQCVTEGPGNGASPNYYLRFDAATAAAGVVPTWTLSEVKGPSGILTINNNASATVTITNTAPTWTYYLSMTGTNQASVQFVFPAIASVTDGFMISIYTAAAIGTAATYSSTGGTFPGAPATFAANQVARFMKSGTFWLPA